VRNHLSGRIRDTALCHTEMARELAALQAVVSSATKLALGHSLDETFWVEVVGELVGEFRRLEELCSRLERSSVRICDLLLGPPFGRARWADRLDEAAGQLGAELAARQEVDTEPKALWTLAA
jgi:hypothetical protein